MLLKLVSTRTRLSDDLLRLQTLPLTSELRMRMRCRESTKWLKDRVEKHRAELSLTRMGPASESRPG